MVMEGDLVFGKILQKKTTWVWYAAAGDTGTTVVCLINKIKLLSGQSSKKTSKNLKKIILQKTQSSKFWSVTLSASYLNTDQYVHSEKIKISLKNFERRIVFIRRTWLHCTIHKKSENSWDWKVSWSKKDKSNSGWTANSYLRRLEDRKR